MALFDEIPIGCVVVKDGNHWERTQCAEGVATGERVINAGYEGCFERRELAFAQLYRFVTVSLVLCVVRRWSRTVKRGLQAQSQKFGAAGDL